MVGIKQCTAWAVVGSTMLGAQAHTSEVDAVQRQLIQSSATLNALSQACGRLAPSAAEHARADLREALVSQGVAPQAYDAAYQQAQQQFWQQWYSAQPQHQHSSCEQMLWRSAQQDPAP